ncbi:MAG TPA: aspartate 1-decarboxylase [Nitrospiria bacterium]|nr:aspartate 1-decarboxylase [Nitrospiria bacterium]
MLRMMLRSKIHRAVITQAELDYEGSITIDQTLIEAAGMLPYEQVMVSNLHNGERFETYVIPGERGSGQICLNGPTARKGMVGDQIIVFCYELYNEEELKTYKPLIVKVNDQNKIVS